MDGVTFFSKTDLNRAGKIASQLPASYFKQHVDELNESIAADERALARGHVPPDRIPDIKASLAARRERLESIQHGAPALTAGQKDGLAKERKDLGEKIKSASFSYDERQKGLASAHEEHRRLSTPCIELTKEQVASAKACQIPVVEGKINRNQAQRLWKILGHRLGDENTRTDTLRRVRQFGPRS